MAAISIATKKDDAFHGHQDAELGAATTGIPEICNSNTGDVSTHGAPIVSRRPASFASCLVFLATSPVALITMAAVAAGAVCSVVLATSSDGPWITITDNLGLAKMTLAPRSCVNAGFVMNMSTMEINPAVHQDCDKAVDIATTWLNDVNDRAKPIRDSLDTMQPLLVANAVGSVAAAVVCGALVILRACKPDASAARPSCCSLAVDVFPVDDNHGSRLTACLKVTLVAALSLCLVPPVAALSMWAVGSTMQAAQACTPTSLTETPVTITPHAPVVMSIAASVLSLVPVGFAILSSSGYLSVANAGQLAGWVGVSGGTVLMAVVPHASLSLSAVATYIGGLTIVMGVMTMALVKVPDDPKAQRDDEDAGAGDFSSGSGGEPSRSLIGGRPDLGSSPVHERLGGTMVLPGCASSCGLLASGCPVMAGCGVPGFIAGGLALLSAPLAGMLGIRALVPVLGPGLAVAAPVVVHASVSAGVSYISGPLTAVVAVIAAAPMLVPAVAGLEAMRASSPGCRSWCTRLLPLVLALAAVGISLFSDSVVAERTCGCYGDDAFC